MIGDQLIPEPAKPGDTNEHTVYDSSASSANNGTSAESSARNERRAKVFIFSDVAVTVKSYAKSSGGSFRQIATDASTGSTVFTKEYPFYGVDQKLTLTCASPPSVWEVSIRICDEQAALT